MRIVCEKLCKSKLEKFAFGKMSESDDGRNQEKVHFVHILLDLDSSKKIYSIILLNIVETSIS